MPGGAPRGAVEHRQDGNSALRSGSGRAPNPKRICPCDGSSVTATQLAVASASTGNLPLQLVKANPATGIGAMQGVAYIQRVATRGGVAPSAVCSAANMGQKQTVKYQADYIFWRAA